MSLFSVLKSLILPEPVQHEAWQRYRTGYPLHQRTEPVHEPEHEVWLDLRIEQIKQRQTGAMPQLLLPAPAPAPRQQTGPYRLPHLRKMDIAEVPTARNLRETTSADEQAYAESMARIARARLAPDFVENDWLNDPMPPVLSPLATDALACSDKLTLPPGQVSDALSELAAQQPDEDTVEVPAFMRRKHTKESE